MAAQPVAKKKTLFTELKSALTESKATGLCPSEFMDEIKEFTTIERSSA